MNISKALLRLAGWKVSITVPDYPKSIICVAPHTSNWDFVLGKLAYSSVGRKAGFLMKDSWFVFPLGYIFKALGGIPVVRKRKGGNLTEAIVHKFNESDRLTIAITPEGTRSRTTKWHTGFLRIAREANIPIALGVIDGGTRTLSIERTFIPGSDIEADMLTIKQFYSTVTPLYPEKFTTDDDNA
ncbi:MAG: 1-acyl-sn-glycerol-3-phosphate acyltransferase [Muribaculaceae bacterium]|nr:1-acyl-sn-glycerol-3-phosphate acyltransferase [Muribaculaceae bacterium]